MTEKITMPKNVQSFVDKYGGIGSKEQNSAFWKEFRKAANAYANVQAKRICDLEHAPRRRENPNEENDFMTTENTNTPLIADCLSAPCSRLFRVQVTFETVIFAEDEKEAKRKVKYGTGEIDDMPVSVLALPIESKDGLPQEWDTACLPWHGPENKTIAEILSANDNH